MKIRCYFVDDNPVFFITYRQYVKKMSELEIVGMETDPYRALQDLKEGKLLADISFLDIDMPGMSGLELAEKIKDMTKVVFTTGYREYGSEAFELNALDYIEKPISFQRFSRCIEKYKELYTAKNLAVLRNDEYFFIPGNGKGNYIKVASEDIVFIKSEGNYLLFVLKEKQRYMSYMSLQQFTSMVNTKRFIRVHRSYIINIAKIDKLDSRFAYMADGSEIPISKSYKSELMQIITDRR